MQKTVYALLTVLALALAACISASAELFAPDGKTVAGIARRADTDPEFLPTRAAPWKRWTAGCGSATKVMDGGQEIGIGRRKKESEDRTAVVFALRT